MFYGEKKWCEYILTRPRCKIIQYVGQASDAYIDYLHTQCVFTPDDNGEDNNDHKYHRRLGLVFFFVFNCQRIWNQYCTIESSLDSIFPSDSYWLFWYRKPPNTKPKIPRGTWVSYWSYQKNLYLPYHWQFCLASSEFWNLKFFIIWLNLKLIIRTDRRDDDGSSWCWWWYVGHDSGAGAGSGGKTGLLEPRGGGGWF